MIIAIDFDGTIVHHAYPLIGAPVDGALEKMKQFVNDGHQIILWTMRSGETLGEAIEYLYSNGIELFGINRNPEQDSWTKSQKAYAHIYIDDAAYGCPLTYPQGYDEHLLRPWVDWSKINISPAR